MIKGEDFDEEVSGEELNGGNNNGKVQTRLGILKSIYLMALVEGWLCAWDKAAASPCFLLI